MAYNALSGTVFAPEYFGPSPGGTLTNIVSGNLGKSDGSQIKNVPRVGNATNNSLVTNVGGDANTLTCETNLTFDGTSNVLNVTGKITASVGVSSSYFEGDGSRLTGVGSSLTVKTGSSAVSSVATINMSLLGLVQDLGSGEVAVTGTIGLPEDGSYADGLFTEFRSTTPIGTAIDKLNEILKIIAPSPAPSAGAINHSLPLGTGTKLSFGAANAVTHYTSSGTDAGMVPATARNKIYSASVQGTTTKLGVYNGAQDITGTINYSTNYKYTNDILNYASGAFGNAELGTLKLKLNGSDIHTVALNGSDPGAGTPGSGSGTSLTSNSGFVNLSISASSFDGNGAEWYTFQHRTAKYKVAASDMKVGWNYVQVVHTVGSTNYSTNYIEWMNDPSGSVNDLSVRNPRIENVTLTGAKYLSGVKYSTNATANYKSEVLNMYRNVFPASGTPITFTVTNSSTPTSQAVPDIEVGNNNTKILSITGALNVNANVDNLLSGTVTANLSATHPLKSNIANTGSASTLAGFLIDNRTLNSTNLIEYFHEESYRKASASYATQVSVDSATSIWNSINHMTGGGATGHTDGLLLFNQRLYSPVDNDIPVGGNFTALNYVYTGQPDYSGVSGTRTYYRVLTNSSGASIRDLKISVNKANTGFSSTTLDSANVRFLIKNPGSTEYMNAKTNFVYGNVGENAGALINGADDNSNTAGGSNAVHCVTFGTASVANGDYVVVKVEADESWGGYLSQITFQLGASDVSAPTEAVVLDDIDANNSGIDARLSFGTSNNITNYSNATGSAISLADFNSNSLYNLSGDRRGIFDSKPTLTGDLNEDVSANTPSYSANSFKDAYSGILALEVNGTEVHSTNIHNLNTITDNFNGNDSGFSVSSVSFSETTDGIPDYRKPYRTGTYQVGANDQNLGWNYARVIHRHGGSDYVTNYVEWVVDSDSNNLAASNVAISNFDHSTLYYQSGIGYFASPPSGTYSYDATNVYRNVYQDGTAISFPSTTNCSISNIRISGTGIHTTSSAAASLNLGLLNNSSNCEETVLQVTGTVLFDTLTSISGSSLYTNHSVAVDSRVLHPLKSNLSTAQLSKTAFMVYSGTIGSTSTSSAEHFGLESYRIVSGNYVSQGSVTASSNTWNSARSVNDVGSYPKHADGLASANGYLLTPFNLGNSGDTRNVADGGVLQAPASNPNYSTLTNATRSYYRHFINDSGLAKSTFKLKLYGDANLVSKAGAFNTGILATNKNITVELKVPYDPNFSGLDDTSTKWGDAIRPYSAGVQPTADGVGILNLGGTDLTQTVGNAGREIPLQLQSSQARSTQYFVVKISAHKDWTGYLSRIEVDYT